MTKKTRMTTGARAVVVRRASHAWLVGLGLLGACVADDPDDGGESNVCFPVPAGASVRKVALGRETQGTSLQGRAPGEQDQGRCLQGAAPGEDCQGTSLQGRAPVAPRQAQCPPNASPGESCQGTSLQGRMSRENFTINGGERGSIARAYRGLGDLNGAHFALSADASQAVALIDGQLTAPGLPDSAAFRNAPITATSADGRTFRVDVAAITLDGRTRRTELLVEGLPVCEPGDHGVLVPGRWDARGHHVEDATEITYSCMSGVIAKCVSWGYAPWLTSAADHAACTRLARADYCGDGTSWTMDGTLIGVHDQLGVQPQASGGSLQFEAAWGPEGALCVARTRYQIEASSGDTLQPSCFATLPLCHSLDEAAALGAVLANHSKVTPIAACE